MSQDKDEIVKMAREAGLWVTGFPTEHIEHFAALCRAPLVAENEGLKKSLESVLSQLKERDAELERVREQEPFAWARPDAVDASQDFRFIEIDDFTVPLYATPTSAVPVVEMLVGALRELSQSDGLPRTLTQCAAAVTQADTAIAAGQKYLKESGK